jgi:Cu/Ag efflux protein CusF
MKHTATLTLVLALSASGIAFAQSTSMKPRGTNDNMGEHKCMDMKGMNGSGMQGMGMGMAGMDAQKCKEMMNAKGSQNPGNDAKAAVHKTVAVVKATDPANGMVTLAHEPIQSLKWPAMTMAFAVKDKRLFDKLAVGKKVNVELVKEGSDYVVTSVN